MSRTQVEAEQRRIAKQVQTRAARLDHVYEGYRQDPALEHLRYRAKFVPGHGNHTPLILFVTEAPNEAEDAARQLLVGPLARCVSELLMSVDLKPQHCYATAVVKYRPPSGREPRPDEITASTPYLEREVAILKPNLVVPMGRTATSVFVPGAHLNTVRGTALASVHGYTVIPMMNPLSMLYHPALRPIIFDDFQKVGASV